MKKLVISLLFAMMAFSLVACGSKEKDQTTKPNTNVTKPADKDEKPSNNDSTPAEKPDNNAKPDEGNKPDEDEDKELSNKTLGGKLALEFKKQIKDSTDISAIAKALAAEDFSTYSCDVLDASEGFLTGFKEEIKGFKKGVTFRPMIGSIPFVGYIFETDDAEALKATLLDKADPRWNICTEAAETICVTSGNYVFFTMCPGEE